MDWSGARDAAVQRRTIWVAEASGGELRSLTAGRTRAETVDHLLGVADDQTLIGLDFAFSFPAWWVRACGADDGPAMWEVAAARGEEWLAECPPPFWGRPGRRRPVAGAGRPEAGGPEAGGPEAGRSEWRRTELAGPPGAARPKSVFQVGGAGAVGTGSIRGMPDLARLRAAGMAVWPFDGGPFSATNGARGAPAVAEVYPRWCTGPVVKSRAAARAAHIATRWPGVAPALATLAAASEDAFDAACTALLLSEAVVELEGGDAMDRVEGRVLAAADPGSTAWR
ncbi:MAG TPA: hypothetical protein VGI06_16985 [Acidimicrobiales bacterium]